MLSEKMEQTGYKAVKYDSGVPASVEDSLTLEAPLQININGNPYTVTMRTPGDDALLTKGLLFTEGIVESNNDIITYEEIPSPESAYTITANVAIETELLKNFNLENRTILSSASCGVCGKKELCDLHMPQEFLRHNWELDIQLLTTLQVKMQEAQTLFQETGGCHGVGIFTIDGELLVLKEDIGRHNAVDKTIGYLLETNLFKKAAVIFVSGRVSYEIVAKTHRAGIPYLVAVSAPSTLAVELCEKVGISLIGFCRGSKATVYTHTNRILKEEA